MLVLIAKIPFFANQTQFKSFFPHNITTTARHPSNFSHLAISEGKEIQKPSTKTFPINQLRAICFKASRYYSSTCLTVSRLSWIHHGKAKKIFKGRNTKNHFDHGDGDKFASLPFLSVFSFQLSASCDRRFGSSLVPSKTADTREQAFLRSEH